VFVANLIADTFDISLNSVQKFKDAISSAGTIILAGVPGKYEEEGYRQGTKEVFEAIANSDAYKVAGGGDAEAAITLLGLNDKFDWISVGGGAMLEFLAKKTLPGIEALRR
jgi:phosphoglycerate kinase